MISFTNVDNSLLFISLVVKILIFSSNHGALASIVVSPSLSDDPSYNDSDCFISTLDDSRNTTVLIGDSSHLCTFNILATTTALVRIPGNMPDGFLLYIERNRLSDECQSDKILAVYGHRSTCSFLLPYGNVLLNLRGNVNISITEISASRIQAPRCYGDESTLGVNQTTPRCDLKRFDAVQTCDNSIDAFCKISFPPNCTSILGYRQACLNCSVENGVYQEKVLITYPRSSNSILNMTQNNILAIEVNAFKAIPHLKELNLGHNQLRRLPQGIFVSSKSLTDLFLNHNNLTSLSKSWFDGLGMLSFLDISSNKISALGSNLFSSLPNLKQLLLRLNQITTIDVQAFRGLGKLYRLKLYNNQIAELPLNVFEDLLSLEQLDFGSNKLQVLDCNVLNTSANLTRLRLERNSLSKIRNCEFRRFTNLELLPMYLNKLTTLNVSTFAGARNLKSLSLGNNGLSTLPSGLLTGLISLQVLGLDSNYIDHLPSEILKGLFELRTLYLNYNFLSYLHKELLSDLVNLHTLTVKSNELKHIDSDVFLNTRNLAVLDLSGNMLNRVPELDNIHNLFIVNLRGNSLLSVSQELFPTMIRNETFVFASQHEICECFVPTGINCSASSQRSPYLTCDRLLSDRVLVAMMWLIGLNALGGNAFVLWYNNKRESNKNRIQTFLCSNLALSDLLMGVYMIIIAIADIYFGDLFPMLAEGWRKGATCRMAGTLAVISSESSVFFVTLISIDRLISVRYRRSSFKLRPISAKTAAVAIWLFSITLGTIASFLAGKNPNFYDNSHVCIGLPLALFESYTTSSTSKRLYVLYRPFDIEISRSLPNERKIGMYFSTTIFLAMNSACFLLILICYVSIIRTVYLSSKRAGLTSEMKTQIRLTLKVAAIVLTDFFCWFPIILLGVLVQAQVVTLPPSVFAWAVTFVLPINSAINPYLYTIADVISNRRKENAERNRIRTRDSSSQSRSYVRWDMTASRSQEVQSTTVSTTETSPRERVTLPNIPDNQEMCESNL